MSRTTPLKKKPSAMGDKCNSRDGTCSCGDKCDSGTVLESGTLEGAVRTSSSQPEASRSVEGLSRLPERPVLAFTSEGDNCDIDKISVDNSLTETSVLIDNPEQTGDYISIRSNSFGSVHDISTYSIARQNQADILNSSVSSRESRFSRKSGRRSKKCNRLQRVAAEVITGSLPPEYAAIIIEEGTNPTSGSHIDQLATATTSFIDTRNNHPTASHAFRIGRFAPDDSDTRVLCGCLRRRISRPSLPFVIGIVTLGGVAFCVGGIVLGATGIIEHSTHYMSVSLLMIGIGVSLMIVAAAIWKLSRPDSSENCSCLRDVERCQLCNSPYCNNRITGAHQFSPDFQHRLPPPSYLTSLNEYTVGFLLNRDSSDELPRQPQFVYNTPPPAYRSTNSICTLTLATRSVLPSIIPPETSAQGPETSNRATDRNAPKEITYLELD